MHVCGSGSLTSRFPAGILFSSRRLEKNKKWPLIPNPTRSRSWGLKLKCEINDGGVAAGGENRQHRGLRNSLQKRREFEASSVDKYFLESWVMSLERTHLKICFYQQTTLRQESKWMQHIHQQRDQKLSHSWEEKYPSSALLRIIISPALKKCSKIHFSIFGKLFFLKSKIQREHHSPFTDITSIGWLSFS